MTPLRIPVRNHELLFLSLSCTCILNFLGVGFPVSGPCKYILDYLGQLILFMIQYCRQNILYVQCKCTDDEIEFLAHGICFFTPEIDVLALLLLGLSLPEENVFIGFGDDMISRFN